MDAFINDMKYQWQHMEKYGLTLDRFKENLQETMFFTMKCGCVPVIFPVNQSNE